MSTEKEIWITLRFKGSADVDADAGRAAENLLKSLEATIEAGGAAHGFTVCQPGDVIEVEEEADIYNLNDPA